MFQFTVSENLFKATKKQWVNEYMFFLLMLESRKARFCVVSNINTRRGNRLSPGEL